MTSEFVLPTGTRDYAEIYFANLPLDPRLKGYAFLGNIWFPTIVCGTYLWLVYSALPKFMANRPAYDLKRPIMFHNAFMVLANSFFFWKFFSNSFMANYSPFCQGMTYATDKHSMQIVHWGYWYLMLRILDFLDTIFFVLRKKQSHVTFQHVSHHFCCVFSGHLWVSLGMDGQTLAGLCVNSMIHVLMYSYYFLAACGPQMKPFLWWKKYLTKAQIYQHVFLCLHGMVPVFHDCGYPKFFIYLGLPQGLLGLALFLNFYVTAYSNYKKSKGAPSVSNKSVYAQINEELEKQKLLFKGECLKEE